MINVGVIGLGMMGLTHLDAYAKRSDVNIVAISDTNPDRLSGKVRAVGNVEGQAQGGVDLSRTKRIPEGMDLIKEKDVQLVDICLQTPQHYEYALAALRKGKHVLVEKPMCRTAKDAQRLAKAAAKAKGLSMVAQCIRFWPGWTFIKDAVEKNTYGPVRSAYFRRVASHPGGEFYVDGSRCGGAILDLHIHDVDFVQYVFGTPKAVTSKGYTKITGQIDHVLTHYEYDSVPLVVAEGCWCMAPGFGFKMQFTVNFENATAVYDLGAKDPLTLVKDGKAEAVALSAGMGYDHEIAYFLDCIAKGEKPRTVTLESAANSVRIAEAEIKSIQTGKTVKIKA
jgi:predicted dehydrogenase